MKIDIKQFLTQKNSIKIAGIILIALILGAAFFDLFYSPALAYLTEVSRQGLTYLGAVAGIKVVTAMFTLSEGVDHILTRILNFFVFTNAILFAQLVLLKLSKLLVIKAALAICFISFIIFKSYRALLFRLLLLLLLINPGISLYILSIRYIADQAKLDISNTINTKLTEIDGIAKSGFLPPEDEADKISGTTYEDREDDREKSLFTQFAEKITEIKEKTEQKIEKVRTFSTQKARELIEKIEELLFSVIQYFVTIIIQYLLLPLLYFYGFYNLFKKITARVDSQLPLFLQPPGKEKEKKRDTGTPEQSA